MPQLPPVAAAAFVISLLMVILVTTVIVQVRARRDRMRLAEMVRATAPIPRPAASSVAAILEAPFDATPSPLRGNDYGRAEREARFRAFDERASTQEAAPGRPCSTVGCSGRPRGGCDGPAAGCRAPERPMPVAAAVEAPQASPEQAPVAAPIEVAAVVEVATPPSPTVSVAAPAVRMQTHGGLASVILDFERPMVTVTSLAPPEPVAVVEGAIADPVVAEPEREQSVLAVPAAADPATPPRAPEALRQAIHKAVREPVREQKVTVLAPRHVAPTVPALMTREMTLGDAARALRSGLTMTDGRHVRRAVAVGAATSVVAAAFAIRGRKR